MFFSRLFGFSRTILNTMASTIPIVYSDDYNISFFGLEDILHAFDSKKYGRVFNTISSKYKFTISDCYKPQPLDETKLLIVHTQDYLNSLKSSLKVATIAEVPLLYFFPRCIIQPRLLNPMLLATSGTLLASRLALKHGWAINLSGGYHHAKPHTGEGFCFFADIPLAVHELLEDTQSKVKKILIVDLDAHQGNGFQTIFTEKPLNPNSIKYQKDDRVEIFDMYNGAIYPGDRFAKQFITYNFPLKSYTEDEEYLNKLRNNLPKVIRESKPDFVFFNAGTDIYERDPLGALSISAEAIIKRDEIVFQLCREHNIPICMVLSGGYTMESANIISNSISNLIDKKIIQLHPVDITRDKFESEL